MAGLYLDQWNGESCSGSGGHITKLAIGELSRCSSLCPVFTFVALLCFTFVLHNNVPSYSHLFERHFEW